MAGPIKYEEFFNSDIKAKLAELVSQVDTLDTSFQDLSKTITGMSGRINVSIKGNSAVLKEMDTALDKVDVTAKGASDTLTQYAKVLDATAKQSTNLKTQQTALDQIFDTSAASVDDLKSRVKILTAEYNALGRATDADKAKAQALAGEVRKLKAEQEGLTTALNKTKTALQGAEGSYTAMSNRLNQLRKDLKDMPNAINQQTGAWNQANPAVKRHLEEITKLDVALKKVDSTLGNHQRNVGNYAGALSGVKDQLVTLIAGYVSVQGAMQLAGKAFDSSIRLDAINAALAFTFKSADVAEQKLQNLRDAAKRLGLEYVPLANSYKMFTAAAMAANFPIREAEKLFYATATAGARLKLSTDDVEGSLRAFVQMISKGNVQAEELRGQLGERLYGAFSMAARSIGKTEQELNKMLQKGEVLASDLLPKLAIELDNTFGLKQGEKIDNLQSSWNKFKNIFDLSVEASNVQKFFKAIIDGTGSVADHLTTLVNSASFKEFFFRLQGWDALSGKGGSDFDFSSSRSEVDRKALIGRFSAMNRGQQQSILNGAGFAKDAAVDRAKKTGQKDDIAFANEQIKTLKALQEAYLNLYQAQQKVSGAKIVEENKKTDEAVKTNLDLLREKIEKITTALQLQRLAGKDAGDTYLEAIDNLNKLQEQLEYAMTGRRPQVKEAGMVGMGRETRLRGISKNAGEVKPVQLSGSYKDSGAFEEMIADAFSSLRGSIGPIGELFGQEFAGLFDGLTTNLQNFLDGSGNEFEDWAATGIAAIRSIDEAYKQGTALRIEQLQLEKQAQIDIAGTNKDARLSIEKEYNDRIRAEKIKQARLDKQAAIFQIAISTAVAAQKVLGQTGLFGLPLVPVVIALGAAQIATVLARPIPQFRTGTQSAPGGLAEVAEDGPEAIISPSGHLRIAHKRQITYLEPKSKVLTTPETKRFLEMQDLDRTTDLHSRLSVSLSNGKRDEQIKTMAAAFYASRVNAGEIGEAVGKQISSLPFTATTFDESGVSKFIQTRTTRTKILNDRYSLK